MINNKGELIKSVYDDCINYTPNLDKPLGVRCEKFGNLYECTKLEGKHCGDCKNRKII
jgi:hypothetical protein